MLPAVEAVAAREGTLPLSQRLTGTVRAHGEVAIVPQSEGTVAEVFAQNGERVSKGAPLVQIRTAGVVAQTAQARSAVKAARAELALADANLHLLESQFRRNEILGEQGLVPADAVTTQRAQVDAARANVARARAEVAVAEAAVEERRDIQRQTLIRAPISGRVGQRNAEVGLRVGPQTTLFVIGRLDEVRVEVPVTQELLARVREGQRVEIHAGQHGGAASRAGKRTKPLQAHVSRVSPFLSQGSLSAEVEIDVNNRRGMLVPGMFVSVDVFYGESARATLVPASALYEDPSTGTRGVFVASAAPFGTSLDESEGHAELSSSPVTASLALSPPAPLTFRPVTIAAVGNQTVGIEGVEPGEWVVVVGQHLLAAQDHDKNSPRARIRPITWERILELQQLQRQDLLLQFMDKQQRLSRRPASTRMPSGDRAEAL